MKPATLLYKHSLYSKALYWGKLVTVTGGAQIIVQGTGLLAGILIIRLLPTEEYAYYTLANTMLGVMTMLSDGGISNGVMSLGGKVWQDKAKLGVVLASGLELRKKFAIVALSLGGASLAFLLIRNGASWFTTGLIVLALLPSFLAALSDSLLEIVPKLHQQVNSLQKNQTAVGIGRLFLTGLCLLVFPFTWVAVLVNGIVRAYGNLKLMDVAYRFADRASQPDAQTRREIVQAVKRIMPITLYYCLSSQIIIWIPSLIGNVESVAQVGALSRLAMVLNLISTLISTLILPRFARLPVNNKAEVVRSFLYIQFLLGFICVGVLGIFALFPTQFLWVLGKSYSNLSSQLVLMILANCIGLTASITGNIIASRGWYINPFIIIAINIFSLVISLFLFNLSQTTGVLYYNILLGTITYFFTLGYGVIRIMSYNYEKA
jgi:O-antigen/teichoic acid export membrane protein